MCIHVMPVSMCLRCYEGTVVNEPRVQLCPAAISRGRLSCYVNPNHPPRFDTREGNYGCKKCKPTTSTRPSNPASGSSSSPPPPPPPYSQKPPVNPRVSTNAGQTTADAELAYQQNLSAALEQSRIEALARKMAEARQTTAASNLVDATLQAYAQGQKAGSSRPQVIQQIVNVVQPTMPGPTPQSSSKAPQPSTSTKKGTKSQSGKVVNCPSFPPFMSSKDQVTRINGRGAFVRKR